MSARDLHSGAPHSGKAVLDLRGVRCPLNWARAKVRIEGMEHGERLTLQLDDPRAAADIPRAAEAEGWYVLEVSEPDSGGAFRVEIEK